MVHEVIPIRFDERNLEKKLRLSFLYKMRFGLGNINAKMFESLGNKGRGYIWYGWSRLGKKSQVSVADIATTLPSGWTSNLRLNSNSSKTIVFQPKRPYRLCTHPPSC